MAHRVIMPRVSQDMEQGRVVEWLKHEGDAVAEGEPLLVIESDKAEVELPAPVGGVLRRVLMEVGADVAVGHVLGILGEADEIIDEGGLAAPSGAPREGEPASPATIAPPAIAPGSRLAASDGARPASPAPRGGRPHPSSPAARRAAQELGVDLASVVGTGPDGLITETDVRSFADASPGGTAGDGDILEALPLEGTRRRIAERLVLSRQTAADVTTVAEVDMSAIADLRSQSGSSYTAYVLHAAAQSLRDFPILNASLVDRRILVHRSIHLGVAVAAENGLVVPVIRDADGKSVAEISAVTDELAARARRGELTPADLTGSTFTVTNSGAFGSLFFTPIINLPEVAILGMGKIADTPVVRDGAIVIGKVMYLCLTYDHRVVDGEPAVRFLQAVKERLERPEDTAP